MLPNEINETIKGREETMLPNFQKMQVQKCQMQRYKDEGKRSYSICKARLKGIKKILKTDNNRQANSKGLSMVKYVIEYPCSR